MKTPLWSLVLAIFFVIAFSVQAQAAPRESTKGDGLVTDTSLQLKSDPDQELQEAKSRYLPPAVANPMEPSIPTGQTGYVPVPGPDVIQADDHRCPEGYHCVTTHGGFLESCHKGHGQVDCHIIAEYCRSQAKAPADERESNYSYYCED